MKQNLPAPVTLHDEESVSSVVMFADRQTISSARTLRDSGEMIAPVTIARTGIMLYKAKELGEQFADLPPEQIVQVDTPAEVLFDENTLELCRSMAVTVGHPKDDVSLQNNKSLQKGFLEGRPAPDGSHLSGHIVLNDAATIKLVDSGIDQTSWGHTAEIQRVEKDGVVSAVKTKITAVNHLAIVRRGRAQTTRIGDSGEEIEIVDKSVYDAVEAERDAAKDKIAKLEQKLADSAAERLTDEQVQTLVEERVKARSDLLAKVAKLGDEVSDMDFTGMSESQIRRKVVEKLLDKDFSDKSDIYLDGRFDSLVEDSNAVSLSDALSTSLQSTEQPKPAKSPRDEALERRAARYNK